MPSLEDLQGYLAIVTPAIAWFSTVALLVAVSFLVANAAKLRGHRSHTPAVDRAQVRRDQLIFRAAFGSFAVVYFALIAGSFNNLTSWARGTLGWTGWEQFIVPVSLDGLGTAAGFLAFRAIKKHLSPYLCYAMVWGATIASAWINADEGSTHGDTAAFYMAFLSFGVMAMFHLFIEQWQEGAEFIGRKYPRFGIRWVTYFGPTLLDFLCWVNHPPMEDLEPTVVNAVEHRKAHRERKAEAAHMSALVSAQRKAELSALQEDTREGIPGDIDTDSGPDSGQDTAADIRADRTPDTATQRTRTRQRTARRDIRADIARARKTNPDISQKDLAKKLGVSEKTIQRHTPKPVANLTLVQKEAAK